MKLALELPVASQLDENDFVEQQPHKVERLGHVAGFFPNISHRYVSILVYVCLDRGKRDGCRIRSLQRAALCDS